MKARDEMYVLATDPWVKIGVAALIIDLFS